LDKFIFKKSNALNLDQCQYFIDQIENCPKSDILFDKFRGYFALNKCRESEKLKWIELHSILIDFFNEYVSLHPFLMTKGMEEWTFDSRMNLQKYLPGNYYKQEHCEHGPSLEATGRVLGWMIYLNDIKKGGGTCWPQQNFISTAKVGDLYIWPAAWTHSHHGMVAPNEIKYILTGWCNYTQSINNQSFFPDMNRGNISQSKSEKKYMYVCSQLP